MFALKSGLDLGGEGGQKAVGKIEKGPIFVAEGDTKFFKIFENLLMKSK